MSYIPSVSGTMYAPPPSSSINLTKSDLLKWLPPLDVALYQVSFGYLLSSVQFDRLGHYSDNPRKPYFADVRVEPVVTEFQMNLNRIEIDIHKRNAHRPFPYLLQLPSMIPNSISI
jgi:arachidonate 15-lipoxygenase